MELYSGLPYWIAKNPMNNYYNPLLSEHKTDIAIIGTGITGALVAHELCNAGFECTMIDRRSVSTGSSIASTALLQYEIDTPLSELARLIGEESAVLAYQSCLKSIDDLDITFKKIGYNPEFEKVPSTFYASNHKGSKIIEEELEIRKRYNLPVVFLSKEELKAKYGIKAPCALENHSSAQMDAYAGANALITYNMRKNNLQVFTHTDVDHCEEKSSGYDIVTVDGNRIKCKYVIIAAGFEAGKFLPEKVMDLTSTYVILSQPVDPAALWAERSLIWETREPYLYIRTVNKNRILVGGEDENFRNPLLRDRLLRKKVNILEKKFKKLFPDIPFITEMAWCGTFSSTSDGLPFIGPWPGKERMLFALGYGGNGITFSMIAAQMIRTRLKGLEDEREKVFSFQRLKKS